MKRIISILLIIIGVAAVIYGFIEYQESQELIEVGQLEVETGSKSPGQTAIWYWIGGGVAIVAGLLTGRR